MPTVRTTIPSEPLPRVACGVELPPTVADTPVAATVSWRTVVAGVLPVVVLVRVTEPAEALISEPSVSDGLAAVSENVPAPASWWLRVYDAVMAPTVSTEPRVAPLAVMVTSPVHRAAEPVPSWLSPLKVRLIPLIVRTPASERVPVSVTVYGGTVVPAAMSASTAVIAASRSAEVEPTT